MLVLIPISCTNLKYVDMNWIAEISRDNICWLFIATLMIIMMRMRGGQTSKKTHESEDGHDDDLLERCGPVNSHFHHLFIIFSHVNSYMLRLYHSYACFYLIIAIV